METLHIHVFGSFVYFVFDGIDLESFHKNNSIYYMPTPGSASKHFYYFIGRLNPPHEGHILALHTLIQKAKADHTTALILLGSGPGGVETLDNPIPFELKKQFIEYKLGEADSRYYEIIKMDRPASQVSQYVAKGLSGQVPYKSISITHVAGGKDEDTTKLAFVLNAAENVAKSLAPSAIVKAATMAIDPIQTTGEPMSATKVRKSVYKGYLSGQSREELLSEWEYKSFYGDMAKEIYEAIRKPADGMPREEIEEYIHTGTIKTMKTVKTVKTVKRVQTRRVSTKTANRQTPTPNRQTLTRRSQTLTQSPTPNRQTLTRRSQSPTTNRQTKRARTPTPKTQSPQNPTKRARFTPSNGGTRKHRQTKTRR